MTHEAALDAAAGAVRDSWEVGCPVAAGDPRSLGKFAVRRWNSRARRLANPDDLNASINDLAKGLVQHLEPDQQTIGPLFEDYRFLASKVATALDAC